MFFSEEEQVKLRRIAEVFLCWQIFNVFAAGLVVAPISNREKARITPFFTRLGTPQR
jgi:hypothetical protein